MYHRAVLERLDEGWVAAMPLSFMGLRLGTRMTVVRLAGGDLWVHSPIAPSPDLRREVDALGPVGHLVAPNLYHHRFLDSWRVAYPHAVLHGPKALARKRKDLTLSAPLEDARAASWAGELSPVHVEGSALDETVFVHPRDANGRQLRSDRELHHQPALADPRVPQDVRHARQDRLAALLRVLYRDRAAALHSLDALFEHDFDRVVIAHGDVIGQDGKAAVRQTFEFLRA